MAAMLKLRILKAGAVLGDPKNAGDVVDVPVADILRCNMISGATPTAVPEAIAQIRDSAAAAESAEWANVNGLLQMVQDGTYVDPVPAADDKKAKAAATADDKK